jgi:SAM-dependent methyltransferase
MGPTPRPKPPAGAVPLAPYPNVYDAAFSWDRSQEARTFLRVARTRRGSPPRSAVELACGTGPLARLWAGWGIDAYGVDRSRTAIARARQLGRGIIPPEHWVTSDITNFRLPRQVDLAAVPLDGLGYLVEENGLLGFFRAARRSLTPGGILAIDLTLHPAGGDPLTIRNSWKVALRPRGNLRASWNSRGRAWGTPPRHWEVGRIAVKVPGRPVQVFWEASPHAALTLQDLRVLSNEAGWNGEMWVYSDAAHRAHGARLRRVSSTERVHGSRLVCWQRT